MAKTIREALVSAGVEVGAKESRPDADGNHLDPALREELERRVIDGAEAIAEFVWISTSALQRFSRQRGAVRNRSLWEARKALYLRLAGSSYSAARPDWLPEPYDRVNCGYLVAADEMAAVLRVRAPRYSRLNQPLAVVTCLYRE